MLQNKKIALFMDLDNCGVAYSNYSYALEKLEETGEIVCGKLYGVSEKKHREILADAAGRGFDVALPMRVKKRGSKVFDPRIAIDAVELVTTCPTVDAVAILTAPADSVYLYRFFKKYDVAVLALDNGDEETMALVDEIVDMGLVETLKVPSVKKVAAKTENTAKPAEKAAETDSHRELVNEAQALLDKVEKLRDENEQQVQPQENATAKPASENDSDSDLVAQIEQIRKENGSEDDSELVNKIKDLLDGLE